MPVQLSIVIPLAAGETAWRDLLGDLKGMDATHEILLAGVDPEPDDLGAIAPCARWIRCEPGRARQMNAAAERAAHPYLWFLHADSRVRPAGIAALISAVEEHPRDLHYFNLRFQKDGPPLMFLNTVGAWIRSHWFGMPFGDQGLCLSAKAFADLGGYDESARIAEDHLFVREAKRRGIRLRCTGHAVTTSARKYREQGWFRITGRHLAYTLRQAWPASAFPPGGKVL